MNKIVKTIGILSDAHGNYYALTSLLAYFERLGCNQIISLGDMVNIGPHSEQCLRTLLGKDNIICLAGNHDIDFFTDNRITKPFSHTPGEHKSYVFDSIGKDFVGLVSKLPLQYSLVHGKTTFAFAHYALLDSPTSDGYVFESFPATISAHNFDRMFANMTCNVVFFGHKHEPCDVVGDKVYVDVGSVGCHKSPLARGIVLYLFENGSYQYDRVAVDYDRQQLCLDMTNARLPYGKYLFDFYFDKITHRTAEIL